MHDRELSVWRTLMEDGTKRLGEEQYRDAAECFSQALFIAYQLTVPEIVAFSLRLLATVSAHLDDLKSAEEGFREALRICQEVQNAKGMAEAWAGLANLSMKKKMYSDAGRQYELAISVYPGSSPQLRLAMLYADLGQVYTTLGNWLKANKAYAQAHEICHVNGFSKGEAEMDVLLGELCLRQGKRMEAANFLKQAGQIFVALEDVFALANTLQYLALVYFDDNEVQLAFECQQRAVALGLKSADPANGISESCYFLSIIEQFLENYEEAKYYLELSIHFYPEQDVNLALRYQSLAGLFFLSMDFVKAERCYYKALSLYETLDDDRVYEIYDALNVLKECRKRQGEPIKNQEHPEETVPLDGEFALEALVRLAEFYEKQKKYRDALECYWKALQMVRDADYATEWIELRVQRVSKFLRRKKGKR